MDWLSHVSRGWGVKEDEDVLPGMELLSCPDMAVPREVMHHVVRVESSYNPYAIGVVGGRLVRQPRNLAEAVSTARMLEQRGYNFSLGLAQVNRYNLAKYGLDSYTKAFQPCANLQAGSRILAECYRRSGDWGKSFSCYYSGDFKTGYRHGYVQKVYASMRQGQRGDVVPIPVIDRAQRRAVATRTDIQPVVTPTAGLIERRGGMVALQPPAAVAPAPAPAAAGGVATVPATAMAFAAPVSLPLQAQPQPSAHPSASPAPGAAVVVAATRHGASPAQSPSRIEDGGDGAFVF